MFLLNLTKSWTYFVSFTDKVEDLIQGKQEINNSAELEDIHVPHSLASNARVFELTIAFLYVYIYTNNLYM